MIETMRQIADAGEALGFLCSSVRCGTEWGPEHDQARDVLRAALRRVAEPVDEDAYPDFTDEQWEKIKAALPKPSGKLRPLGPPGW